MLTLDRPRDHDVHTLCDFAELVCLTNADRIVTKDSFKDYLLDQCDTRISDEQLDDCLRHLSWRTAAFHDYYPFSVDLRDQMMTAPQMLIDKPKLYVFLLLCANLPFLPAPYTPLTDAFERLAVLALQQSWPKGGTVRPFGKNLTNYAGQKWERLNALAADIGATGLCTEATFRARDSGDGGIDVAAWYNLEDSHERKNVPAALAQCACSRDDWSRKQTEISYARLAAHVLTPTHPWMQLLFIPQSFRNSLGTWAVPGEVGQIVLYDRLRILKTLPEQALRQINAPALLEEFLGERAPLV